MARTEPAAKVTRLANRHTTQVGTHPQHDKPLWSLDAVGIRLWVAQFGDIDAFRLFDFVRGAVADEDGFAAPFDDDLYRLVYLSNLLRE